MSDEFVYRSPLELPQLMNLILKREVPGTRVHNLSEELPTRKEQLMILLTSEGVREEMGREYPNFIPRLDNFIGLDTEVWKTQIRELSQRYLNDTPVRRVARFVEGLKFTEIRDSVLRQLVNNFSIRKYKLRGTFEWRLEDLFDVLGVTEHCRQIVLVKPLENKILHKLTNRFGDRTSTVHSKTSLIQIPSRERKLNNYIGMTISKYDRSRDVAVVIIEEIPGRQKTKQPLLQITVEIPGERRLGDVETDGAYGTTVLKYFLDCVSRRDRERERELLSRLQKIQYQVFDVQLFTRSYDLEAVRYVLTEMSMHPDFQPVFFSQNRNKVDDQRFILRGFPLSENTGGVRKVLVDIQSKGVVFQSLTGDLFDIYDIASLMIAYAARRGEINPFGIPGMGRSLLAVSREEGGEGELRMDVVEKTGEGEYILREAIFFDSHFSDVCNKPAEKDILRGGELEEDFGYFPPKELIDKLESEGRFSFPYYESQKIKVKLNYVGEKKSYVLGKRKIPKSVRDSMAAKGNYAFIFDFFPCRKEGKDLSFQLWERDETTTAEDVKAEYILDENKDEILPGRYGKVQLNFFDSLRSSDSGEILRTGVPESPVSFIEAAKFASGRNFIRDFKEWVSHPSTKTKLISLLPQFPDISEGELEERIKGMLSTFVDSRYLIRIVEEFVGMNIVVMSYVEKGGLEYALYETPLGVYTPNIFEHLHRNLDRETILLLRRSYQYLPDQYDVLVEKPTRKTFSTARVIDFLKNKISLADIDVHPSKTLDTTSLIDLSMGRSLDIPRVGEESQVIDTTGSRSGTLYKIGEGFYPCFHLNPGTPDPKLPLINLYDFLLKPRPTIYEVLKDGSPWKKFPIVGVGVTKIYKEEYITSLYLYADSHPLCLLVKITPRDETMKKLFAGKPLMETPDPYISNQMRDTNFRFNDVILRRSFGKMLGGFLLQILFVELVERSRKQGIEPLDPGYKSWRERLITLDEDPKTKTIETAGLEIFYKMIQDIKSLSGIIPQNPLKNLSSLEHLGKFFSGGSIRCPSKRMYAKLLSQLQLMERVITTVPELQGLGGVPFAVYRIQGLYDMTTVLSESPDSVLGMESDLKHPDQYLLWQTRCQTSLDRVTLYDSILPEFFDSTFQLSPLIGFYGSRNTGLWSIRPPVSQPNREMGVVKVSTKMGQGKNDISRFNYMDGKEILQIGAQEDSEDRSV
ncbi:MAG: hypothetical protein VKM97_00985, partial [Cyanobacteriota bacterium]|nr:hypothetical protein [Cyanobacteriota bacterium]